jgi:hypothetical protein
MGLSPGLDPESHERILVGIHFYKLDMPIRIVLAQGLSNRFRNHAQRTKPSWSMEAFDEWYMVLPHSFILAFFLSFWSWTMVAIIHFGYQGLIQELGRLIH